MIKPILISKGVEHSTSCKEQDICLNTSTNNLFTIYENLAYYCNRDKYLRPQDIILVDTKAEIVDGDLAIYDHDDLEEAEQHLIDCGCYTGKAIVSTNKSHNLPLLSPQSIQLLINYYNTHKCMTESVEVEMEQADPMDWERLNLVIKLNPQGIVDTTIPETRKYLMTSKDGVRMYEGDIFWYTMNKSKVRGCKVPNINSEYYSSREIAESKLTKSIKDCVASHEGDTQYLGKLYTEGEMDTKLNHILNDILCLRVDNDLIKMPNSNKISEFVSKWFNIYK